jgi:hypothetical protein
MHHLVCLSGNVQGRKLKVKPGKPLTINLQGADGRPGTVAVEQHAHQLVLTNCSPAQVLVNGKATPRTVLRQGDEIAIGAQRFRVGGEDEPITAAHPRVSRAPAPRPHVAAPPAPPARAATGSSDRHQRRISASRLSAISEVQQKGLLARVGDVFSGRHSRGQLDKLERERRELLAQAGRASLDQGGIGLSHPLIANLVRGETVKLSPRDLDAAAFQRWREYRSRLTTLDAEIAAVRRALGLGDDPELHLAPLAPLRSETKARSERAFALMDAMATEMLDEPPPASRR